MSKALNLLGIAIGFARPIEILIRNIAAPQDILPKLIKGLTFGLSEGSLDLTAGAKMYAPVGAAVGYGAFKSYLIRKFPVR